MGLFRTRIRVASVARFIFALFLGSARNPEAVRYYTESTGGRERYVFVLRVLRRRFFFFYNKPILLAALNYYSEKTFEIRSHIVRNYYSPRFLFFFFFFYQPDSAIGIIIMAILSQDL